MKRKIIAIMDEGTITVPVGVRMTIIEIANLLGIYCKTAEHHIRAIEKAGIADGDYRMTCSAQGASVQPEYYGLDMIIAVAFRVKSWKADRFRKWLLERATQPPQPPISVIVPVKERALPN